jgi:Flp pilus assembly protein TadB
MTTLAAVAGAMIAGGLVLLIRELFLRRVPPPGTPPRGTGRLAPAVRKRVLLAVPAGLAALAITRWPVLGIAVAAGVLFLPRLGSGREAKRRTAVLEGLEQWTRRLGDVLTASRGLEEALENSARSAPAAIAGPVTRMARQLSARTGAEAALRAFADDIDDPAADRIAAALIIATGRRGGAVRGVLTALAEMLARDVASRREIAAEQAEHRTTVRWIVGIVGGFTVFAIFNRAYSAPFGTTDGQIVLAIVAGLYAGGLAWLQHLGSIPVPGRFLSPAAGARSQDRSPEQAGSPR